MSDIIAREKDTFRFLTDEREDPRKKTLDVRKTQFVEIYNPFEKRMPRPRLNAAWNAAIPIVSGNVRYIITSPTG
jgi:3'-phosphoadenosine 5'-phosphosulfate sulfotransferase